MAVENGTNSFMPSKLLSTFENDISPLMAFLGNASDYILYEKPISESFHSFWHKAGTTLPAFIKGSQLKNLTVDNVIPWGWSQIINAKYADTGHQPPIFSSKGDYRRFFSRETSLHLCHELKKRSLHPFAAIPALPVNVCDISDISLLLDKYTNGVLLKTLWSSSGRGLQFIRNIKQLQNAGNWINAQIKKHGSLIAEPIYNKLQDASLQFMVTPSGDYEFLGLNYFDADDQGHFNKEYFHTPENLITRIPSDKAWVKHTADVITESMKSLKLHEKYYGPIGIDAMFIADEHGDIKFYPLVEANLRCNMGLINLHLKKRILSDASGTWQISQFNKGEAPLFYQENIKMHPIIIENGHIAKGFFPLTPFENDTRFAAWGMVY
ncbi:hypothetical protein [Carboxylicivirga sp. RSCT41]|uniref:hypothetical protein n=1 Tax=Carboxylicivirga agarovorans TaxID=3417570 RepID=UPI003D34BD58